MDKIYNHFLVEKDKNQKWKNSKSFSTHDSTLPPYCVVLPPPNITGVLHMGHALNLYIQDTVIRYKKFKNFDVLFLPCMDHAGIATQAKIDEELYNRGIQRSQISREEFFEFAEGWKQNYQEKIRQQWSKLGAAFDWENERFTLDKEANHFVNDTFLKMYKDGLIYQDTKGIVWDCKMLTAISNIEITYKSVEQKMYFIKYPLSGEKNEYLIVATTRPETLGSDVAVGLNPNDPRAKELEGKWIDHPFVDRKIPIVFDESIELEAGTGIMKVSAHALQDLEIIKQNSLEVIETINEKGFTYNLPEGFNNLERFEAREKIAKLLEEKGFLLKTETQVSNVGFSQRSGTVVEYLLKKQWFVKVGPLAEKVLENLKTNQMTFYPSRFKDVLKKWLEKAHDWTISRQLWWGHRIPAWYKDDQVKVQVESPGEGWIQDEDVLDTWFSSALIPANFLEKTDDKTLLERYFPTQLLVTAYDIIFFWVARMYFQSLYLKNEIPFEKVLVHGLIRDDKGQKMSKSLGNGIEPTEVIEKYGSDALRIFLLFNSSPGNDVKFSFPKIEAAWNFLNKIWNIARFIKTFEGEENQNSQLEDWIDLKLKLFGAQIDAHMENFEFALVFKEIQDFVINTLSSNYLEFSKVFWDSAKVKEVFEKTLIILHPFIPFLTDHLFVEVFEKEIQDQKPQPLESKINQLTDHPIEKAISFIREIRNFKSQNQIPNSKKLNIFLQKGDFEEQEKFLIERVLNCEFSNSKEGVLLKDIEFEAFINWEASSQIDNSKEEKTKILEKLKEEIERCQKLLNTDGFVSKAPKQLIEEEKEKLRKFQQRYLELQGK